MKIYFIPGLGPDQEFYSPLLSILPELRLVPIPGFTYREVEDYLGSRTCTEEPVLLCGWSLGALFALRWTLAHPERVAALFLTGATACFCSRVGYANGIKERNLEIMIRLVKKNSPLVLKSFYSSALAEIPDKKKVINKLLEQPVPFSSFLGGLEELAATNLLEKLEEIRVPVDIVQGKKDPITPLAGARVIAARIPACRLEERPGGHCLFREQPETFSSLLKKFIERNQRDS